MCKVEVNDSSTKANSPPCARARVKSSFCFFAILNNVPKKNNTAALMTINDSTNKVTKPSSSNNNGKSIEAPTVIKNRPSKRPLKGSMSTSNSCLNSLSAKTTPAKNVPRAGDRPIFCIITAITITRNKAKTVNSSRRRVSAM